MTPAQVRVLDAALRLCSPAGGCVPVDAVAAEAGLTRRTAVLCLRALRRDGLVEVRGGVASPTRAAREVVRE